jgi:hypothetical protein
MNREKKAAKICAKLQLRAYKRKLTPLERSRWDRMIKIILAERQREKQ